MKKSKQAANAIVNALKTGNAAAIVIAIARAIQAAAVQNQPALAAHQSSQTAANPTILSSVAAATETTWND